MVVLLERLSLERRREQVCNNVGNRFSLYGVRTTGKEAILFLYHVKEEKRKGGGKKGRKDKRRKEGRKRGRKEGGKENRRKYGMEKK